VLSHLRSLSLCSELAVDDGIIILSTGPNETDSHPVTQGRKPTPFRFKLRQDTEIFLVPSADRVAIIYELSFQDRVDRAIARIMLQVSHLCCVRDPVKWLTSGLSGCALRSPIVVSPR